MAAGMGGEPGVAAGEGSVMELGRREWRMLLAKPRFSSKLWAGGFSSWGWKYRSEYWKLQIKLLIPLLISWGGVARTDIWVMLSS